MISNFSAQVTLDGNLFSPLELKIFARQVRECERLKLDTLALTNCKLDDACLAEVGKFAFRVRSLNLQGGQFGAEGLRSLAKHCRRHDWEKVRAISLRGCQLRSDSLDGAGELALGLEHLNLSYNNFSGSDPEVRDFAATLAGPPPEGAEKRIRFVDLRHCRLSDASKRILADVGRKEKIEIKMW